MLVWLSGKLEDLTDEEKGGKEEGPKLSVGWKV